MAETARRKKWLPLEANPQVMEDFLRPLGFPPAAGFHDVYGLDDELLAMVPQPVLALLLLFPADNEHEALKKEEEEKVRQRGQSVSPDVWFTLQTVGNACGTIGLLHAVANNADGLRLAPGSYLHRFLQKTRDMQPTERAKYLEEDNELEEAHSTAATEGDTAAPQISDAVDFHFIAFVCVDGGLYELDGSRPFPIHHGPSSKETLLKVRDPTPGSGPGPHAPHLSKEGATWRTRARPPPRRQLAANLHLARLFRCNHTPLWKSFFLRVRLLGALGACCVFQKEPTHERTQLGLRARALDVELRG